MIKKTTACGKYLAVLQSEKFMNDAISSVLAALHEAARRKRGSPKTKGGAPIGQPSFLPEISEKGGSALGFVERRENSKIIQSSRSCSFESGKDNQCNSAVFRRPLQYGAPDKLSFSTRSCSAKEAAVAKSRRHGDWVTESKSVHYLAETLQPSKVDASSCVGGENEVNCSTKEAVAVTFTTSRDRDGLVARHAGSESETLQSSKEDASSGCGDWNEIDCSTKEALVARQHDDWVTGRAESESVHCLNKAFQPRKVDASSEIREPPPISETRRLQKLPQQHTRRSRKDSAGIPGDVKQSDGTTDDFGKDLVSIQITKDEQFHEITVRASELDRVLRKYPLLGGVLPEVDKPEKEIPYCAEAVKGILGYLFHPSYDFGAIPEGRTCVEMLAASRAWGLDRFHGLLRRRFAAHCLLPLAAHFGLAGEPTSGRRAVRPRSCLAAASRYAEPSECAVPLSRVRSPLPDCFDRDVRCTLTAEAVGGEFRVAGFRIALDCRPGTPGTLDLLYSVRPTGEEGSLSRPLRPDIAVRFRREAEVRRGESVRISVEATIKPCLCFEAAAGGDGRLFRLTADSTYRSAAGGKRFMIGKLLYHPM